MAEVLDRKEQSKRYGAFCKNFRIEYLRMGLVEFSEQTDLNYKSVSAFESGRANSLVYLYHYYNMASENQKKVFANNIFERVGGCFNG